MFTYIHIYKRASLLSTPFEVTPVSSATSAPHNISITRGVPVEVDAMASPPTEEVSMHSHPIYTTPSSALPSPHVVPI